MTHAHKRKTSRNEWFWMDVPKDIRALAGQTSWQHSLETTGPTLAAARRATYSAQYKGEVIRLRGLLALQVAQDSGTLVDRALARLTAFSGSLDIAVAGELQKVATIVRSS